MTDFADVAGNKQGPPYDDKPCPMCPMEIRNLVAVVHNLAWRLEDYQRNGESSCKVVEKFQAMKAAVDTMFGHCDWPKELRLLYDMASSAARCETLEALLKYTTILKSASDGVQPLADAHFADRKHSHGDLSI
jgi:hypothetical protein